MSQQSLPPSVVKLLNQGALYEGKYRLLRPLGEGSFASVLHARHEAMDRDVALKFLRPDVLKQHPEVGERFLTEVRLASRLTNPHTVTIFDFGRTEEETPYMVLEYVDGRPLDYAIEKYGALGLKRSIRITMQILDSLEEAHANHIIHRDLKPANIMIGKGMTKDPKKRVQAKVLDFGVAKLVEKAEEKFKTESGRQSTQFIGTPRYMSPEQILGQKVSPASDLYSLGLIFFEMCTGKESLCADNVARVAQAHLDEEPLELTGIEELPGVLRDIVRKATSRQVEDRYGDVIEFRQALDAAVEAGKRKHKKATVPAEARQENTAAQKRKSAARQRTSDVFSGKGYVEVPTEEGMVRSPSAAGNRPPTPGSRSSNRHPSPSPARAQAKSDKSRKSTGGNRQSSTPSPTANELDLDLEPVQKQRRELARKRRRSYSEREAARKKESLAPIWTGSMVGVAIAGFAGFAIVGGALTTFATPMRLAMAVLPVGLALLWALFSESPYPDTARRVMVPWAKRSLLMVVIFIGLFAVIMPDAAAQSLRNDALWFMSGWPEGMQMGWFISMTQGICEGAAWGLDLIGRLIPWSS